WVQSSPAIGSDGTVYLGSQDNKLYAIGEYTVAFSLQAGWNMISVPLVLENPSPEAVFPSGWPLYRWEPLQGRYAGRSEITLAIGKGYWLKAPTPYNLSITGQPNMEDSFTISLSQGWNLIGTPYEAAIGWSTVRVHKALVLKNLDDAISAGWIKSPFYRWTGSIYAALGSGGAFQPKAGYWVNVLAPGCTLTFIR
ncbi:MAG: PQQ-binding-like beta-propeller repeat protein, partial [bacterium]